MLAVAEHGMPLSTWRAAAADQARLLASDRRTTQLRIAAAILRPVDRAIVDDGFLADWRPADEPTRHDLVFARYLGSLQLAVAGAQALFTPAVREERSAIAPKDVDEALTTLLTTHSPATIRRSQTSFRTEFARADVVRVRRDGGLELTAARPARVAVLHLIRDDLRERREATDTWLATHSLAAMLFALPAHALREYLDVLVREGRLQRSYYSGEPRILAA